MEVPSMTMKREITVTVNGQEHHSEVEPRLLLVHYLREMLDLTGTHIGCDTSQCGACTVLLNGESVKACTVLAVQADGCEVTTIEGLAPEGSLHPIHAGFWAKVSLYISSHYFLFLYEEKGQVYNGYCSYGWFANQTA